MVQTDRQSIAALAGTCRMYAYGRGLSVSLKFLQQTAVGDSYNWVGL